MDFTQMATNFPTELQAPPPYALAATADSLRNMRVLLRYQRRIVQTMVCISSSFSIGLALLAIYWFAMMKRNYRRDLVLLLILGDLWKNVTYLAFSIVSLSTGPVNTGTVYCQANGYLLVVGLEMCDLAIFLMSLHMYLQIFPPRHSILGHDGLYRVRRWIYIGWFMVPNICASLAFINKPYGYAAQGAFCYLPIRPYWSRLTLTWGPRYIIWVFVMWVAFSIYKHVGREFKVFGVEQDRSTSMNMTAQSSVNRHMQAEILKSQAAKGDGVRKDGSSDSIDQENVAPDDDIAPICQVPSIQSSAVPSEDIAPFYAGRRPSAPVWSTPFASGTNDILPNMASRSNPSSRRGSHIIGANTVAEDFAPVDFDPNLHRGSIGTLESHKSHPSSESSPALATIDESRPPTITLSSHRASIGDNAAQRALQQRRRAIQRQLRLLFIYPCVYLIMWLIPFVSHCTNYTDQFATHPIFWLSALASFCQTSMGSVDVIVFSWRERPWRHIPGSDGTFLGSLQWWRFCFQDTWLGNHHGRNHSNVSLDIAMDDENGEERRASSQKGLLTTWNPFRPSSTRSGSSSAQRPSSQRVPSHRRSNSGGSDRKKMEADLAYERLQLERQEWAEKQSRFLDTRQASVASQSANNDGPSKEWFDQRRFSEDLIVRKDDKDPRGGSDGTKIEE